MIEQVFTFGYGHACPYTGRNLADHYAIVVAGDEEQCRALMLGMFGQQWSFQYDSVDKATRGGKFPMVEHVRLVVAPPASVAIVCTGRPVDDNLQPVGEPCGRKLPGRYFPGNHDAIDRARAAGWRISDLRPDGTRGVMCPACARPDPAIAQGLTTTKEQ